MAKSKSKDKSSGHLKRDMTLTGLVMLAVGAMIGAGVFLLVGMAAGQAGPGLILAFFLNGIIALIVGSCYAELISAVPRAGGVYHWSRIALSPQAGFFSGWMSWFAQATACSLYALGFGSFFTEIMKSNLGFPSGDSLLISRLISVSVIILFLIVNLRGSGKTDRTEIVLSGIKLSMLIVVIAFGLSAIFSKPAPLSAYRPFLPEGFIGVLGAMGLTFIAFEGFEVIAQSGEEVKNPGKTIPRAIFISILLVIFVYLMISVVLQGAVKAPEGISTHKYLGQMGELGLMESSRQFMPMGKQILLLAGLASTASALNATIFSSTRIAFAMGRHGSLPTDLRKIHSKTGAPYVAILISGLVMTIMTLSLPIKDVAASADIMFLLVFVMVCASVWRLRRMRPDIKRPYRAPLFPFMPLFGILSGIGLSLSLFHVSLWAWLTFAIWIAGGGLVYFLYSRKKMQVTSELS